MLICLLCLNWFQYLLSRICHILSSDFFYFCCQLRRSSKHYTIHASQMRLGSPVHYSTGNLFNQLVKHASRTKLSMRADYKVVKIGHQII